MLDTEIVINGVAVKVTVSRMVRKTLSARICRGPRIEIKAPLFMSKDAVTDWIFAHEKLIQRRIERLASVYDDALPADPLRTEEINALRQKAKAVFPERVAHFCALFGVSAEKITVRHQRTRFGSCSAKGNLSLNCLLLLCPLDVIDYVVAHEVCHRKHFDHSPAFWAELGRVLPCYKESKRWLRENGAALIARLPEK